MLRMTGLRRLIVPAAAGLMQLSPVQAKAAFEGFENQEYLFLLEPAYVQHAGEFQGAAAYDRSFETDLSLLELEVEYGLTRRLQASAETPMLFGGGETEFGDVEFAAAYALLLEEGGPAPALTAALAATAPIGEKELSNDAWTYEISLRASKQVLHDFYLHASAAYEWFRQDAEALFADRAWMFGAGAAWKMHERFTLITECLYEREQEDADGEFDIEQRTYFSFGGAYEVADEFLIGAAGAAGLSDARDDARLMARLQFEL